MATPMRSNGVRSRKAILARGVSIAAAEGLSGVSIGALSEALGMSKSGVFAHFGSKPGLDAALVDAAAALFEQDVTRPADAAPPGVARLIALSEAWLTQGAASPLTLLTAFVPRADGAVRERLQLWRRLWHGRLASELQAAVLSGELSRGLDPARAAFEIDALLSAAHQDAEAGNGRAAGYARLAIEGRLRLWAASGPADTPPS